MKVYVRQDGVTMVGKAWEIRRKLFEYQEHYHYVKDWVTSNSTLRPK